MEVFPGISMDPDVRFGKPCLAGTRIDVATIVGALAAGESVDTVAEEYQLSVAQVLPPSATPLTSPPICTPPSAWRRDDPAR
jgi:uncharacterized protein (DUF433 family)